MSNQETGSTNATDAEAFKAEIDEIMSRVDTIMDKVARVIPEADRAADGQE